MERKRVPARLPLTAGGKLPGADTPELLWRRPGRFLRAGGCLAGRCGCLTGGAALPALPPLPWTRSCLDTAAAPSGAPRAGPPRPPSAVPHGHAASPLASTVREAGSRRRSARSLAGWAARVGRARRCGASVASSPVPSCPVPSRSGIPGRMVSALSPPRAPFPLPPPASRSAPSRRHRGLCKPLSCSTAAQALAAARLPRTAHPGEAPHSNGKTTPGKTPGFAKYLTCSRHAWFFLAQLTDRRIVRGPAALLEWNRPGPEVEPERDLHNSDGK